MWCRNTNTSWSLLLWFIFLAGSSLFSGPVFCQSSVTSNYSNGTCHLLNYTCNVSSAVCSPDSPIPMWNASTNITSLNVNEIFLWKGGRSFPNLTGPLLIPRNRTCTTYTVQINSTDREYTCCTDQCDLNPCYNNGTCNAGTDSFQCSCAAGYTGNHCELKQRCEDKPCKNGDCESIGADYKCSCSSGYVGKNCELNQINCNTSPCPSGATCIEGQNGEKRSCVCKPGFEGDGTYCTAICTSFVTRCGGSTITFMKNYVDLTSYSDKKCPNDRHIASIKCVSVSDTGHAAFDNLTFACLPCNESISSVNAPIEKATTASVSLAVEQLQLITTGTSTPTQTTAVTNLLTNLTEATLTKNITVTNSTISNILLITEQVTTDISTSTNKREIQNILVKTIEVFVQALKLPPNSSTVTIATERYVVKIDRPKATGKSEGKAYVNPLKYSLKSYQNKTETQSNTTVAPEKKQTVSFTVPAAVLNSLLFRARLAPGELQVFVVLHQDASLFGTTNDYTTEVLQASASGATFGGIYALGGDFDLKFENQASPTPELINTVPSRQELKVAFQCVFWDIRNTNWSPEGCRLTVSNGDHTCTCNHFTSFALLLRVKKVTMDLEIDYFSLIACSISLVSLVLTIIIYVAVPELRKRKATPILLNICICLSLGYLFFLIGIDKVKLDTFCYAVALILHTTFLCAWFWMLVYSLNIYYALVKVFGGRSLIQKKAFMYFLGYGVPITIVLINFTAAIVIDTRNRNDTNILFFESEYRVKQACWLRSYSFYIGFLASVSAILLANMILFFITIRRLTWKKQEIRSSKEAADTKQQFLMAATLVLMMGLTWLFGYIMMFSNEEIYFIVFSNLFNVFNATQGLTIFLVNCVRQKKVRNLWLVPVLKFFRCTKCLPTVKDASLVDSTSNNASMFTSKTDTIAHAPLSTTNTTTSL